MATAIDWIIKVDLEIKLLTHADLEAYQAHFMRHRAESGRGDIHFMPFAPDDPTGPRGLGADGLNLDCDAPGWQRWWVAWNEEGNMVGHVDLKGDHLRSGMHHCELGIGIERPWRGQGLGRKLMQTAIEFCRECETIEWLDLRVFANNENARALYLALGFSEVGRLPDRFRIEGHQLDDILMTLNVVES